MMWRRNAAFGAIASMLLVLTGCRHQVRVIASPKLLVTSISVPPPTHQFEPMPTIASENLPALTLQIPYLPLPRFRPRPTTARQLALLLPPAPRPLALGELSTGGELTDKPLRQQTESLLHSQQMRLQALSRPSAALHSQQVEQARLFLRQALEAWREHDIEAAHVLATKAKLLMDEI